MRRIALSVVMMVLGVALIAGAAVSIFPTALFGLDPYVGTHASVAAAALGIGICLAAVNPAAHVSWVRIGIIYSGLVIVYQVVVNLALGVPMSAAPIILGLVTGILMIVLSPNRTDLLPKSPRAPGAAAALPGTKPARSV